MLDRARLRWLRYGDGVTLGRTTADLPIAVHKKHPLGRGQPFALSLGLDPMCGGRDILPAGIQRLREALVFVDQRRQPLRRCARCSDGNEQKRQRSQ
jgi:hypothetical protein